MTMFGMALTDMVGLLAGGLVLLTFSMRTIAALRLTALASNVAFIAYGVMLEQIPIWALHGILLPINLWHLTQHRVSRAKL